MQKSEQINELAKALATAQGQMGGAKKDSENPFFKSKYADLASVWDAIRKPLSDNGLSITQTTHENKLTTLLLHSSGQWVSGEIEIKSKDQSPQAMGSAITYARRYALAAMVGVYQEDDDANTAEGNASAPRWHISDADAEPPPYDEWGPPAGAAPPPAPVSVNPERPTEKQLARLFYMARQLAWSNQDAHTYVKQKTGKDSTRALTKKEYKDVTDGLQVEIDKKNLVK